MGITFPPPLVVYKRATNPPYLPSTPQVPPLMEPTTENRFILFCCSLAATSSTSVINCWRSHHLLSLVALALFVLLTTALVHWAHPGGPAWGKLHHRTGPNSDLIPGPRGLPFIGSIGLMSSSLAHHHLAAAAQTLNATRLMAYTVGTTRFIITSNLDVAREILHGSSFADRPIKESAYGLMFHRAIGFAPYGPYWRALRRVATGHLFGPKQILASEAHRARIGAQMVRILASKVGGGGGVRVRDIVRRASLTNIMGSVFGRGYGVGCESEEMKEVKGLVEEGYDLLGLLNWADHLPVLAWLDLQGVRLRCGRLVPKVNRFVMKIIEEHRVNSERRSTDHGVADFVDVLLNLQGSEKLCDSDMVAVLWEMIFRGTDTIAVLIEWTLARLTLHQDIQSEVHEELDRVVGRSRAVTGSDTASLPYLQAVLKEVLRIHPPGPLLSWARMATSDVHVDGKLVPAGTTAMVNMWAITHDPQNWKDPLEFRPDRFLDSNEPEFPIFGSDLRLAPFGSGRRSCPGKALGMMTVSFWVATLLHEYDWIEANRVDLSEVLKLSCEMAQPLTVKLVPRRR